MISVISKRH